MANKSCDTRTNAAAQARDVKARFATLRELRQTVLAAYFQPIPQYRTLRIMFANVPKLKTNPDAVRGGGELYYSVAGVEKALRSRIRGGGREQ